MNKYNEIATGVLTNVGGKDNVSNLYHCMTRLRFVLKDKTAAAEDAIKAVKGVLGINWDKSGELQVIIGPDVDNVYKQLLDLTGLKETEKIDENLDEVKDHSLKGILNEIVGAFSACMNPLVPMFVLVGTFNVIAALIGPSFFKLVAEDSALYTNFYNVGQAIIYFLPVLIAVPAARHFKTNQYISLVLACLLVYPSFIELISSGTYTVFGIPATSATYTSSVLPIMLTVFVQKYVEKLADRISPTSMKVILFPFLTVLIMLPLMFCVLGPLGTLIGTLLANAIIGLRTAAGPIETALVTALIPFMTAFGIGRPIFFICMSMLFANGVEYAYMPIAMVLTLSPHFVVTKAAFFSACAICSSAGALMPLSFFSFRILYTELSSSSSRISPASTLASSPSIYLSISGKELTSPSLYRSTGHSKISTSALIAITAASSGSKCAAIASISIASVITIPL